MWQNKSIRRKQHRHIVPRAAAFLERHEIKMPSTTHFLLIPPGGSNAQSNFNAARRLKADLPKGVSGLHGAVFLRDAAIGGPSTRGASSRSSAISLMLRSQESLGLLGAKDQFVYFTKSRPPDERFHRFPHTHTHWGHWSCSPDFAVTKAHLDIRLAALTGVSIAPRLRQAVWEAEIVFKRWNEI